MLFRSSSWLEISLGTGLGMHADLGLYASTVLTAKTDVADDQHVLDVADKTGQAKALIIGVGGMGEKDVAVPFDAVKSTTKDNKTYLVMNANKDELKNAAGFTYDRSTTKWVPEKR